MFPLLNLPLLALKEVIRCAYYQELFYISILSKRAKFVIQISLPRNKIDIKFDVSCVLTINIGSYRLMCSEQLTEYKKIYCKIGTEKMILAQKRKKTHLHWKRPATRRQWFMEKNFKNLFKHVIEVFRKPLVTITFGDYLRNDFILELLKPIKEQNLILKSVTYNRIRPDMDDEEDKLSQILNLCGAASLLILNYEPSKYYRYRAPSPDFFKFDLLWISKGAVWFDLEDFLQCKKVRIQAANHKFTPRYMNGFFQRMLTEECRLECFELKFGARLDFQAVVHGLSDKRIQERRGNFIREVQNANGKKLFIHQDHQRLAVGPTGI